MMILLLILMVLTLIWAAIVDLNESLLPNELILAFAALACGFHMSSDFDYLPYKEMIIGGAVAAGLMLLIRFGAYAYYKSDALGLGDVKLLTAAGIWLGATDFMLALSLGATFGLLHGVIVAANIHKKTGTWPSMSTLTIPAGPGFILGILITGAIAFHDAIF